jgi:hypothetical protein
MWGGRGWKVTERAEGGALRVDSRGAGLEGGRWRLRVEGSFRG